MKITTIGLDLAKSVFHVVCFDEKHQEVTKRMLRRGQVREYFAQREPCRVAMEACAGAHYWGREMEKLGHTVKLIPPQFVKPYVKGNKNDYNDARAIAEAATRPGMRFVGIKTVAQQDIQALHRLREQRVKERTALCNQLRALVAEYGIVMNKGVATVRRGIPLLLEDAENGLSEAFRALLARGYEQLIESEAHIDYYTRQVDAHGRQNAQVRRLQTLPGYAVRLSPACLPVWWGMAAPSGAGAMCRPVWDWCRANIPAAARRCCWGSANGVTSTCAVC